MRYLIITFLSFLLIKANATEVLVSMPLDLETFEQAVENPMFVVLDTRSAKDFAEGHIKKSIFLGIDGPFDSWLKTALPNKDQYLVVIADEGKELLVVNKLHENGYFFVKGFLKGGIKKWEEAAKPLQKTEEVDAVALERVVKRKPILDIRKADEYGQSHLIGAVNNPLSELPVWSKELKSRKTYYVHCASGYRSMIAVSLLELQGNKNVVNVKGGFKAIKENKQLKIVE